MRTDVLGVGFDDLTLEEAAAAGAALVDAGGFHYAVTPNPEFLLAAKHTPAFRQALLGADLVLADGVGVVYSAKILGRPLKGKVPGIDFAQRLLAWMARHGKRLFLLGAKPGVAELAAAQEAAKAAAAPAPAPAKPEPAAEPIRHEPEVDFETFCRVEMLVGQVTACENMKESKKLLKLTVFDGERERTILSGIAKWYKPEDLAGKKVGIVANLAPRPMMGGKYVSEGMVMAADTADGGASVVFFPDDVPTGMRIH